jgi:AGZA family xanthine/uracil permease-like MFS transporter
MMVAILAIVYGRIYLGYSLLNVFFAIAIGTVLYFIFSLFIKDKNWKHWIPESLVQAFPFVMGGILVFFGLFKSGILAAVNSNQVATTLGDSITMVESQIPVFLGYLWNPLTLFVILGICLYLFLHKLYPKNSLLFAYIIISLIGFLVPLQFGGMQVKGNITEFKSFGMYGIKKEGFLLLFSNFRGINSSVIQSFFKILSQSKGLLKLSFLVFITLTFQNLFVINSLDRITPDKQKYPVKIDRQGQMETTETSKTLPYQKLTLTNAFSGILGVFGSLTSFSYAPESALLSITNAKTGITAIFCGLLLLFSAFLSPLGIYSSQAGTPLLFIVVGLTLVFAQFKQVHFETLVDWFPGFLFILVSIITMNPVEGLVIGIIFYVVITLFNNIFSAKKPVKIYPAMWISFGLSLLFIISQIKIEP